MGGRCCCFDNFAGVQLTVEGSPAPPLLRSPAPDLLFTSCKKGDPSRTSKGPKEMSLSILQASLPVFDIGLNALSGVLDKASAFTAAKKVDESGSSPGGSRAGSSGAAASYVMHLRV